MNISELSLRRPVLATVLSILIVVFGVIGFTFLGIRDYPAIDPPVINVRTSYAGANADIIESQITEPLERRLFFSGTLCECRVSVWLDKDI